MQNTRKITDDLIWVGTNDRRLSLFEGVYSVPTGVSYNSYLLLDEKTVLFDTSDKATQERFLENVDAALSGRSLDFLILTHIEPDHSYSTAALLRQYPDVTVVLNEKSAAFLAQFNSFSKKPNVKIVAEGDVLSTGRHELTFVMTPMVHWPEVMVVYDITDKILFSADAFGTFGALNGALFADEVDFLGDYLAEARRYYTNIVGKYGQQVSATLKKASALDIKMICPLHGFVWRKNFHEILRYYKLWSSYQPEEEGVLILYASVYGGTENAAEILSVKLREAGVKTTMHDVSVTDTASIVAEAFRWSHIVFASTTYNAGIFVNMESVIYDIVAHNLQNRTIALIENGSWASTSGALMREQLEKCRDMRFFDTVSIVSSVKPDDIKKLDALALSIKSSMSPPPVFSDELADTPNPQSLFKIPYGLYLVCASDGTKDNGCIVNTVAQVTASPLKISVTINKANLTHDMIAKSGAFSVSVLDKSAPYSLFESFGLATGRVRNKFEGQTPKRTKNGSPYIACHANAVYCANVVSTLDCGSHTIFVAELTQAQAISAEETLTYDYYFANIKPPPAAPPAGKSGFVCKICGYLYEGQDLPSDFICPLCKHGAQDFDKV